MKEVSTTSLLFFNIEMTCGDNERCVPVCHKSGNIATKCNTTLIYGLVKKILLSN